MNLLTLNQLGNINLHQCIGHKLKAGTINSYWPMNYE